MVQVGGFFIQAHINLRVVLQGLQGGQARHHGQGVPAQCSRLVHRAFGRQFFHDFCSSGKGPYRQSTANDFPKSDNVGCNPQAFLRPAQCEAETGHDLIKNQQGPVLIAQSAQPFQKPFGGRNATHVPGNGFDDDGRDGIGMLMEEFLYTGQIVIAGQ